MVRRGVGPGATKRNMPLWQRSWLDAYPFDVPSSLHYPQVPLSALMETAAQRFPARAACSLYGRRTSYARLVEQAQRFAGSLAALGARRGRRIGMLLPNIP